LKSQLRPKWGKGGKKTLLAVRPGLAKEKKYGEHGVERGARVGAIGPHFSSKPRPFPEKKNPTHPQPPKKNLKKKPEKPQTQKGRRIDEIGGVWFGAKNPGAQKKPMASQPRGLFPPTQATPKRAKYQVGVWVCHPLGNQKDPKRAHVNWGWCEDPPPEGQGPKKVGSHRGGAASPGGGARKKKKEKKKKLMNKPPPPSPPLSQKGKKKKGRTSNFLPPLVTSQKGARDPVGAYGVRWGKNQLTASKQNNQNNLRKKITPKPGFGTCPLVPLFKVKWWGGRKLHWTS